MSWMSRVSCLDIRFTFKLFPFLIPVAAKVDYMVARIGPIAPLLFLVDHFGPIHDTIKSTVAVTGIEKYNEKNS